MSIIVVDLFCGAGGTSLGATMAGCRVVLAVDSWTDALAVHKHHHTGTIHMNKKLGTQKPSEFVADIMNCVRSQMTDPNTHLHVHASPPCQHISSTNSKRDVNAGLILVRWTLDLMKALALSAIQFSFSIEQVAHPHVARLFIDNNVAFKVISMGDYGVPQTRRRLLAVSDIRILDLMAQSYTDWRKLVKIPTGGEFVTGTSLCQKRLDNHSFSGRKKHINTALHFYTITRTQAHRFLDEGSKIIANVTVGDMMTLQTFPSGYFDVPVAGLTVLTKLKLNANAVPPEFSRVFFTALQNFLLNHKLPSTDHLPSKLSFSRNGFDELRKFGHFPSKQSATSLLIANVCDTQDRLHPSSFPCTYGTPHECTRQRC